MSDRRTAILSAVDTMIAEHDAWANDPHSPEQPTERMELAIDAAILECASGDVPSDCRELVGAMSALSVRWDDYRAGSWDGRQRPLPDFWRTFQGVMSARKGANKRGYRRPEPVAELIRQKVGYEQIARFIYGDGEKGPFLHDGRIRVDLILQEAEKPGSVVPADWIHPDQIRREAEDLKALNSRLNALQSRDEKRSEDPSTVEELLRQGAFPEQVARVKGISVIDVREIAAQCRLTPNELPNLAAIRAPHEPELTEEQDRAYQPRMSEPVAEDDIEEPEAMSDEALDDLIFESSEKFGSLGSAELAQKLSADLGVSVTAHKVAGVIRSRKRQLQKV